MNGRRHSRSESPHRERREYRRPRHAEFFLPRDKFGAANQRKDIWCHALGLNVGHPGSHCEQKCEPANRGRAHPTMGGFKSQALSRSMTGVDVLRVESRIGISESPMRDGGYLNLPNVLSTERRRNFLALNRNIDGFFRSGGAR
jgi:hypothetical protein